MSKGVNTCMFIGNVGRDPEIRATGGGTMVANFSIAVSDREKVNGEWKDVTEWVNAVAFARTAEIVRDYVRKGSKLYICGRLKTRSWMKDDVKQYRTEILVNDLALLSEGKRDAEPGKYAEPESQSAEISDDDIPF